MHESLEGTIKLKNSESTGDQTKSALTQVKMYLQYGYEKNYTPS